MNYIYNKEIDEKKFLFSLQKNKYKRKLFQLN